MKNNSTYDIAIIGSGVAGSFAALRFAEKHKNLKVLLIEFGRPPGKRRRQLEGWFGCFPTGDGKIYQGDIDKVAELADGRRVKSISKWFWNHLDSVNPTKIVKTKQPSDNVQKKAKEMGFVLNTHSYQQWTPKFIHQLSHQISEIVEHPQNIDFSFNTEVFSLLKKSTLFHINTSQGDFKSKRVILCVGRSGWRWVNETFRKLGLMVEDDVAKFGCRIEMPAQYLKEFNHSHCSFMRDDLTLGPFCWNGSIIQEDHANMTTASFRSNEDRWKSDKVFFSLIGKRQFEDKGCFETDRLARLAFLLSNDRVGRDRIRSFIKNDNQLSLVEEYNWLKDALREVDQLIPNLLGRGYFHVPDILTTTGRIRLASNLESEINGLYVAGESAGLTGIAAAGIMGGIAAESAAQ
jgi:uncharacterized FAD-dependent dehydrogenase